MLDIKPKETYELKWIVRVDKKMDDKVKVLARQHKVEKSTVIRSLVEAGLQLTK